MDELEMLLPTLKFDTSSGLRNNRKKMTKIGEVPHIMHFGIIRDVNCGNWQGARGSVTYPNISNLLDKIALEHFPDFKYTKMQINKNVNCKMHFDVSNVGNTCIFTLGKFEKGELQVE